MKAEVTIRGDKVEITSDKGNEVVLYLDKPMTVQNNGDGIVTVACPETILFGKDRKQTKRS